LGVIVAQTRQGGDPAIRTIPNVQYRIARAAIVEGLCYHKVGKSRRMDLECFRCRWWTCCEVGCEDVATPPHKVIYKAGHSVRLPKKCLRLPIFFLPLSRVLNGIFHQWSSIMITASMFIILKGLAPPTDFIFCSIEPVR